MYEVLPTEPLHDMKEHICNVASELKHHLSQEEKQLCEKTIELVAQTKQKLKMMIPLITRLVTKK